MDDHSSGTSVAGRLARPTRAALTKTQLAGAGPCGTGRPAAPMRSCSRWGLPCRRRRRRRGALLPHPFTLACNHPLRECAGGLLSVALSLGSPPPGITRHRVSVEPGLSSTPPSPAKAAVIQPSGKGRGRDAWAPSQCGTHAAAANTSSSPSVATGSAVDVRATDVGKVIGGRANPAMTASVFSDRPTAGL